MNKKNAKYFQEIIAGNPLFARVNDMAYKLTGLRFIIIFPHESGWGHVNPGETADIPEFCKIIQKTNDGGKQCRMCHILMSIAACREGLREHRCHAGVSVIAVPVQRIKGGEIAMISICMRIYNKDKAWEESKVQGKKLGINTKRLKNVYNELPEPSLEDLEVLQTLMLVAGDAIKESVAHANLKETLKEIHKDNKEKVATYTTVEKEVKNALITITPDYSKLLLKQKDRISTMIAIIIELITNKPSMPYTVQSVSSAIRISANHFSTLFCRQTGKCFLAFVAEKRMMKAQELLRDITLGIGEVAFKVGYNDPSYFSRCFRRITGMSPRVWRDSL